MIIGASDSTQISSFFLSPTVIQIWIFFFILNSQNHCISLLLIFPSLALFQQIRRNFKAYYQFRNCTKQNAARTCQRWYDEKWDLWCKQKLKLWNGSVMSWEMYGFRQKGQEGRIAVGDLAVKDQSEGQNNLFDQFKAVRWSKAWQRENHPQQECHN